MTENEIKKKKKTQMKMYFAASESIRRRSFIENNYHELHIHSALHKIAGNAQCTTSPYRVHSMWIADMRNTRKPFVRRKKRANKIQKRRKKIEKPTKNNN